jgi:hypothetical protein
MFKGGKFESGKKRVRVERKVREEQIQYYTHMLSQRVIIKA